MRCRGGSQHECCGQRRQEAAPPVSPGFPPPQDHGQQCARGRRQTAPNKQEQNRRQPWPRNGGSPHQQGGRNKAKVGPSLVTFGRGRVLFLRQQTSADGGAGLLAEVNRSLWNDWRLRSGGRIGQGSALPEIAPSGALQTGACSSGTGSWEIHG